MASLYKLAITTLDNAANTKVHLKKMDDLALKGLSQLALQTGLI